MSITIEAEITLHSNGDADLKLKGSNTSDASHGELTLLTAFEVPFKVFIETEMKVNGISILEVIKDDTTSHLH